MENQVKIYYAFCLRRAEVSGTYLKYQRAIADQMLNYGFRDCFELEFVWDRVRKGEYGKPYWSGQEEIYFNVSNTDGLVVCGLSHCEIGVDAEKPRRVRMPVIRRCCSTEEMDYILGEENGFPERVNKNQELAEPEGKRFSRIWTLKESYIKMTGEGMRFPLKDAVFLMEKAEEGFQIKCSQPGFFMQNQVKDYWISVCTKERMKAAWQEFQI